jgi:choline dehydrogenase-like flavoprotein
VSNLRVVDASIFPRIPGFFIVVPIYMISEKATDEILAAIGESRARGRTSEVTDPTSVRYAGPRCAD